MVVRGRGESSGDRLNQWAASQLVLRGSQVDDGEGRAHFVLACSRAQDDATRAVSLCRREMNDDSLSIERWPLIAAILTPHAVPDMPARQTITGRLVSLHGLGPGQGSGIRTGQGTQYCTPSSQGPASVP